MPDVARLQAEAEQAEIRGEMARSRSLIAQDSLHKRTIRWTGAKTRLLTASAHTGALCSAERRTGPSG